MCVEKWQLKEGMGRSSAALSCYSNSPHFTKLQVSVATTRMLVEGAGFVFWVGLHNAQFICMYIPLTHVRGIVT